MERNAVIIESNGKRALAIDVESMDSIYQFLESNEKLIKKFKHFKKVFLGTNVLYSDNIYSKEEINKKCKGVTAIKFKGVTKNPRLYCKELITEDAILVIIVADFVEEKKQNNITSKELTVIERVGSYSYSLIEEDEILPPEY